MVKKLLIRDPCTRLGNLRGGPEEICQQKWFQGYNFEQYLTRTMKAPWVPKVTSAVDTSNFDPAEEQSQPDSGYVMRGNWDKDF